MKLGAVSEKICFGKAVFPHYMFKLILIAISVAFLIYIAAAVVVRDRPTITVVVDPASNHKAEGKTEVTVRTKETKRTIKTEKTTVAPVEQAKLEVSRKNMSKCNHVYGKVMVFVAVEPVAYQSQYKVALDSLRCYIASTDYELKIVDVFNDSRVAARCNHTTIYFRKHCAAAVYLEDTDWMVVMDADTGIVNPNHCMEEYIDTRVDMVFYERFFNWEIACGNYLAKNSAFSKDFLMRWANYEFLELGNGWWKGFDNGVIHIVFLESLFSKESQEVKNCHQIWYTSKGYETYMPFVFCVRDYIGATRIWPGKFKLLRRAHGFCRDWYHTNEAWWEKDFMIHGWKAQHVGDKGWQSPFTKDFDLSKCGQNYDGWSWRPEKRLNATVIRQMLADAEKGSANALPKEHMVIPYLAYPDIGECYPDCDVPERIPGIS